MVLFRQLGTAAEAAILMARAQSYSALGEFFLNPVCGALSDCFGRRVFLNSLCAYSVVGNLVLALDPFAKMGEMPFVVIHRAVTGLLSAQAGSMNGTNSLADVSSGTQLGTNVGRCRSRIGSKYVCSKSMICPSKSEI